MPFSFENGTTDYTNIVSIATASVLCFTCICGVLGNTIVIGVGILKRKYQNNVTNCYIINLAITDLLFLLVSVPLTTYLSMQKAWIFGEFLCKIPFYFAYVLLQATCYTLAAMSIDRYLTIVHEGWYRRYRKPKYALIICILIWTVSSVFMFPYDYLLQRDVGTINQSLVILECTVNDNASFLSCLSTFGFYYVLPLLIIILCYSRVSSYIRYHGIKILTHLSGRTSQVIYLRGRRVQRMLLGLILAFALCWLPIHVLELLNCSQILSNTIDSKHIHLLTIVRIIAHGLSYFNSCLNPFLYAILNKSYFSSR
ncbi:unnamed protein product [Adineta steineri]|uniref:G-protein coupled receptors family 1 profile domain-containing protein n=1 Tax=Adineta steineri TaxID=433720 RepID=A0A813X4G9_9BILA|nr:unnamed protein product [Adineta steineri]CAF3534714.1 unnamed protein product [Adineta steineri]